MILAPVLTGQMVEVPYYPGHCYAAFMGNSSTQVFWIFKIMIMLFFLKVQSVTLYRERPDNLLYHICSFHVLDLKVCIYHNPRILNQLTLTNRHVSALL